MAGKNLSLLIGGVVNLNGWSPRGVPQYMVLLAMLLVAHITST